MKHIPMHFAALEILILFPPEPFYHWNKDMRLKLTDPREGRGKEEDLGKEKEVMEEQILAERMGDWESLLKFQHKPKRRKKTKMRGQVQVTLFFPPCIHSSRVELQEWKLIWIFNLRPIKTEAMSALFIVVVPCSILSA